MVKLIDGKALADKIKDEIVKEILKLKGERPNLAIIMVGEREDSQLYVKLKEQEAKKVGIDTHLYKCLDKIDQSQLINTIDCLNRDDLIDAILVQLPLPAQFDADMVIKSIDPTKDVDGFHPDNINKLFKSCNYVGYLPPVFAAVLEILKSINCQLKDKQVCLIINSEIFGRSLAHVLDCQGASTQIASINDLNLADKTKQADILITAVGKPRFIRKEMIKPDAIIIDIGITKQGKKVLGDVDFDQVKDRVAFLTPVPGGVGPLTIAMAFKNTLKLYKKRHKIN